MKQWIPYFLCFVLLATPIFAHPGHGRSSPMHALIEPIHMVEFAGVLIAMITAICLRRRAKSR